MIRPALFAHIIIPVAVAFFLALANPATPGTQSMSEAESILSSASLRLGDVSTLHFVLDIEGETYIDTAGSIRLLGAEGDLARPDRVSVLFRINVLGTADVSIRMITVGEDSWTTDLISGNWGDAPPEFGYNPSVLYDNQDGLGPVMGKIENPQVIGSEKIDERDAYVIIGTVSSSTIQTLTGGTMTGDNIAITLWIDTETNDLLQVRMEEPETAAKEEPATWIMRLSKFDEEVTIEPPIDAS